MRHVAAVALLPVLLLLWSPADAVLQGRDLDRSRPGYEAYYDTARNMTWLADADYAYTSGRSADGRLTFAEALSWAAQLELYGVRGWRLPVVRPADVNGCIAGPVTVGCGPITHQPSELFDLPQDSLALRSIYRHGSRPTWLDYSAAASGAARFQVPGLDRGVVFDNVMSYYWIAGLRSELAECPPGSVCDTGGEPPTPPAVGGFWSPQGETFFRCTIPAQCAASPQPGSGVRGYPDLPSGSFYTGVESVWPWQMDMLTFFQRFLGESNETANVWLVRTGDIAPVPEPASWVAMLVGLSLMWGRFRRGRAGRELASSPARR